MFHLRTLSTFPFLGIVELVKLDEFIWNLKLDILHECRYLSLHVFHQRLTTGIISNGHDQTDEIM